MNKWMLCSTMLAALLASHASRAGRDNSTAKDVRRFALVAGNNEGGEGLIELKYAERDARRVAEVLRRLGRVRRGDMRLLLAGDDQDFMEALESLEARIRRVKSKRPSVETVLIVYYSGHSKDGTLMLGGTRLPLEKLKNFFDSSRADVRIGILDSCKAGEITRLKGGTLAPPFLDVVDNLNASGQVLITSSSYNEDSQESDELGGSFFTHYFVSGLRGAADTSGDGAVTLGEAYEYTYHNTVLKTSGTRAGPQHPAYKFDLEGRGNLVLTRVTTAPARIRFPKGVSGDYLVYDMRRRTVVAEVVKGKDEVRDVGVAPGRYVVKKRRTGDVLLGRIDVPAKGIREVTDEDLKPVPFEEDYTKGAVSITVGGLEVELGSSLGFQGFFQSPVRQDLFFTIPMLSTTVELHNLFARNFSLALDVSMGSRDGDVELEGGVAVPVEYGELGFGVGMNYYANWGWFGLYGGPRLALVYMWRKFKGGGFENWTPQDFTTVCPGIVTGMVANLGRHWKLRLEGRVHYLYYNVDGDQSMGYGEGHFAFGYVF